MLGYKEWDPAQSLAPRLEKRPAFIDVTTVLHSFEANSRTGARIDHSPECRGASTKYQHNEQRP